MASIEWLVTMILIGLIAVLFAIILVWKTARQRKSGLPSKDERTERLKGKAALGAFWITYTFMVMEMLGTIIGQEFLGFPEPEAGWMLIATMLVSSFSFSILNWYYGRKGDF